MDIYKRQIMLRDFKNKIYKSRIMLRKNINLSRNYEKNISLFQDDHKRIRELSRNYKTIDTIGVIIKFTRQRIRATKMDRRKFL